ncbi:cell wall-associated hydrolase [Lachnospiraceae bacterium TWA4]|nr:cell wall-associated hydrolase [Lachnospiraceae bacterium TWA4]
MNKKKIVALLLSLMVCVSMIASVGIFAAPKKAADGSTIAKYAKTLTGKNYKFGATGPNSFDASGYLVYTYKNAVNVDLKKVLGRTCQQMYDKAVSKKFTIAAKNVKAGDLVFYGTSTKKVNFAGIATSNTKVMAVSSTKGVKELSLKKAAGSKAKVIGYVSADKILKAANVNGSKETTKERKPTNTKETTKVKETTKKKVDTSNIAKEAKAVVGKKYAKGGKGPDKFDASGLVIYSYKKGANLDVTKLLGRSSQVMYNNAVKNKLTISAKSLKAGDVVFYGKSAKKISMAAINLGNGKVVYVSSAGVKSANLNTAGGKSVKAVGYASASKIADKLK